jgi:hypothetical protein
MVALRESVVRFDGSSTAKVLPGTLKAIAKNNEAAS